MRAHRKPPAPVLGRIGEEICRQWLASRGFHILDTNYACLIGEIDIIAAKGDTIVFVEVKTRSGASHGSAAEAVCPSKQRRIRQVASHYLSRSQTGTGGLKWSQPRFDVAAVTVDWKQRRGHVHWIANAF